MHPQIFVAATMLVLLPCAASAQALQAPVTRGALLYQNHCAACHTEQMHWREQRKATDWNSLRGQVRHWQGEARLAWSDADIEAVTRHLNGERPAIPS